MTPLKLNNVKQVHFVNMKCDRSKVVLLLWIFFAIYFSFCVDFDGISVPFMPVFTC